MRRTAAGHQQASCFGAHMGLPLCCEYAQPTLPRYVCFVELDLSCLTRQSVPLLSAANMVQCSARSASGIGWPCCLCINVKLPLYKSNVEVFGATSDLLALLMLGLLSRNCCTRMGDAMCDAVQQPSRNYQLRQATPEPSRTVRSLNNIVLNTNRRLFGGTRNCTFSGNTGDAPS